MTIPEFLDELRTCVPRSAWKLNTLGMLRAGWPGHSTEYCPLTALCWWRDSVQFAPDDIEDAAEYLGMYHSDGRLVGEAADFEILAVRELRTALLSATINK